MDPAKVLFMAREKRVNVVDDEDDQCRGCMFERERASVCHRAGAEAKLRGIEDCEAGFIYVPVKVDPRQQDLFNE